MRNLFVKILPLLFVLLVSAWLNAQNTASITGVATDRNWGRDSRNSCAPRE